VNWWSLVRAGLLGCLIVAVLGGSAGRAFGDKPDTFTACVAYQKGGGFCGKTATYLYGDTVWVRGHVDPPHADLRAAVWRKRPHGSAFRRVGSAAIWESGKIKWKWKTTSDDAVQDAPYRFQLRIPGHGRSRIVNAWVIFGE
jgi:hypothetical protein